MQIAFAALLTLLASVIFYLSFKQQNWLKESLPTYPGLILSGLFLCLATWAWLRVFSLIAALFTLATLLMLLLSLFPYFILLKKPDHDAS